MNRDPMTAGGTQDAGVQNPQSEGNSENNFGTDASNNVGQSEAVAGLGNASTESMNMGSDSPARNNTGQVISYDSFTESDSNDMGNEIFNETTVSDAEAPNVDVAMNAVGSNLAVNVADPNPVTAASYPADTFAPTEDSTEMTNAASATNPTPENLAQTPDATVASTAMIANEPEGAMAEAATEEVVTSAENPQPSPAVLSALEGMGVSTDTPATKSVVEPVPDPSQISTAKVPKPNHKGLIVGLIILAVLMLVVGGLAIWFFVFYNNPTKVAFDALGNLVSAENVNTIGSVRIAPPAGVGDSFPLKNIMVNFDSAGVLPGATNATLSFDLEFEELQHPEDEITYPVTPTDYGLEGGHVEIKLGTVQMTDGVIYLRVAGIMASLEEIGAKEGSPIYDSMQEFIEVVELLDDEWWQISVPDLIDNFEPEGDMNEALKDLYDCTLNLVREDKSAELKQLWVAHPFAELEPISRSEFGQTASGGWNGYYNLKFNTTELASFVSGMADTTAARNFYACYNAAAEKAGDDDEISPEDIDEVDASDFSALESSNIVTHLEVSRFGHQLKGITVNSTSTTDTQVSTSLMFTYQPATIVAPDTYRPISEFIGPAVEKINASMGANSGVSEPVVCPDGTTVMNIDDCEVHTTIDDDDWDEM